ncbi:hypothetical protein QC820_16410 [Halomonas mongoliensis]|uniref:Uncharacterized protein n=1 Tax=Halomonas mongoliensis TaxID=321265 RepID=A0ABU1GSI6_9GAMM|nr:hypothetical protein [Halomonas mongoliensis]MDR5894373.1 hypothetical protein [Halomonas mongoliensis]
MKKKNLAAASLLLGAVLAVSGCETVNMAAQPYLSGIGQASSGSEVGEIEIYQHSEYGNNAVFSSLPLDRAIVRVQGSGQHKLAVMMDPVCPASRQLEETLQGLEDTTTYIFVGPYFSSSPLDLAYQQSCQPNNGARLQAYESTMRGVQPNRINPSHACRADSREVYNAFLSFFHQATDLVGEETPTGLPIMFFENDITVMGAPSLENIHKYRAL